VASEPGGDDDLGEVRAELARLADRVEALSQRIETLPTAEQVGRFLSHIEDIADIRERMLERWEAQQRETEAAIKALQEGASEREDNHELAPPPLGQSRLPKIPRSVRSAFVLGAKDIVVLDGILEGVGAPRVYRVTLRDRHGMTFNDCNGVIDLQNERINPIAAIRVVVKSASGPRQRVHMVLRDDHAPVFLDADTFIAGPLSERNNVLYTIEAEQPQVAHLSNRLNSWISDLRPSYYWWLAQCPTLLLLGIPLLALLLVATVANNALPPTPKTGWTWFDATGPIVVWGIIGLISWLIVRIRNGAFPVSTFAIGHGLKRHEDGMTLRVTVFTSGILLQGFWVWIGIMASRPGQ
jgi:hypothetical protein